MMEEPFKVGDIVRYSEGCTALMKITTISRDHAGPGMSRYYGQHILGGSMGTYDPNWPTAEDLKNWNELFPATQRKIDADLRSQLNFMGETYGFQECINVLLDILDEKNNTI